MKRLGLLLMLGTMLGGWSGETRAAQTAYEENLLSGVSCEEPKDCAEMGYTADAANCADPALKCPWDTTKAMCRTEELPLAILYGDGSVAKKVISGKTPIGIVIDEEKRLALALTDVKKDGTPGGEKMPWSDVAVDTPVENCSGDDDKNCIYDGRKNTDILLKETSGTYYAAQAVNKYEPKGCTAAFCKKGKWFLPTIKDLNKVRRYSSYASLIAVILAVEWPDVQYWTSTEEDETWVWKVGLYGSGYSAERKTDTYDKFMFYVKPAIKY